MVRFILIFLQHSTGDSIIFTFSNTVNVISGGVYTINITSHSLDLNIGNDTPISIYKHLHDFYSSDYEMGFEPFHDFSGWELKMLIMILIHGILINIQD